MLAFLVTQKEGDTSMSNSDGSGERELRLVLAVNDFEHFLSASKGAGMAAVVSFHAVCRFFSHHAFDIDRLGLTLARLIVSRLLAADAVIDVAVDATLFRRWGPKVVGAFRTHDGSAQDPNALGRGNRWIIIGIVVAVPFCAHPVPTGAVPVVARPGHRLPGAAGKGTDFDSGPSVPGPTRA